MPKHNKPQPTTVTVQQTTVPVEDRQALTEAFVELVAERYGYFMARRLTQQDMSEKTKKESEAVRKLSKTASKAIEDFIEKPTDALKTTIISTRKELVDAKKVAKDARQPFLDKISPLVKAQKYLDNVAIPDSLKELGHPAQPRFSLSDWVTKAIEQKPKK